MRVEDAKRILEYAVDIRVKLATIAEEKAGIEAELNCLRGIEYGGMPHGSGHTVPQSASYPAGQRPGRNQACHPML